MTEQNASKLRKKIVKLKHLVRHHDGVVASDSDVSPHLVVANIGVDNGIPKGDILNLFKNDSSSSSSLSPTSVPTLHLGAGRSYGYASFPSAADAAATRDFIQGKTMIHPVSGQRLVFVGAFVDVVPESAKRQTRGPFPDGLMVIEDFVDEEEEKALLNVVEDGGEWREVDDGVDPTAQSLKHRRVRHFGYEFRYTTNDVDPSQPLVDDPIPSACQPLLDRLVADGRVSERPDQLTVNRYLPGQGIPPHVDTHSAFEDGIVSLSLGCDAVMDFKSLVDGKQVGVLLKRRSLLIMTSASRYSWTHAIAPRKYDVVTTGDPDTSQVNEIIDTESLEMNENSGVRYRGTRTSFTFRKILPGRKCACSYPAHCDTSRIENGHAPGPKDAAEMTPWQLEATHVHRVYDEIASHFSSTRHTPWPKVKDFVMSLDMGSAILDVGCGNGKYFGLMPRNTLFEVGCDRSLNLSSIAAERGFNALGAEALSLPFRDSAFDAVISIAVVHHLTTPQRRKAAVAEMLRVTRPGGRILITVWAFEQKTKAEGNSKYLGKKEQEGEVEVGEEDGGERKSDDLTSDDVNGNDCDKNGNDQTSHPNADLLKVADLEIHENRTDFKQQDLLVPWHFKKPKQPKRDGNKTNKVDDNCRTQLQEGKTQPSETPAPERVFHRYYHVFKESELESMVQSIHEYDVEIVRSYYDQGNWGVIFAKL